MNDETRLVWSYENEGYGEYYECPFGRVSKATGIDKWDAESTCTGETAPYDTLEQAQIIVEDCALAEARRIAAAFGMEIVEKELEMGVNDVICPHCDKITDLSGCGGSDGIGANTFISHAYICRHCEQVFFVERSGDPLNSLTWENKAVKSFYEKGKDDAK